jgi:hypothetical protein
MESRGSRLPRDMRSTCFSVLKIAHRQLTGDSACDFMQFSNKPVPGNKAVLVVISEGVDNIDCLLAMCELDVPVDEHVGESDALPSAMTEPTQSMLPLNVLAVRPVCFSTSNS